MSADDNKLHELQRKPNIARYCVENPHVSLALLIMVLIWGYMGYQQMPKSKDPQIPVRIALVSAPWPGHSAVEIEELVTRQIEQNIAENPFLNHPNNRSFSIKSLSLPNVSLVQVQLAPGTDRDIAFNEIGVNLQTIEGKLPAGAGPITINTQFGNTAAVLLAVASPKASAIEIALRANDINAAIDRARQQATSNTQRATMVVASPLDVDPGAVNPILRLFESWLTDRQLANDFVFIQGDGYVGLDMATEASDDQLLKTTDDFIFQRLGADRFHPDAWRPTVVRNTADTVAALTKVVGHKYSYRQLDDFSSTIAGNLKTIPEVSTVLRSGVLDQQIDLSYSQERLAAYDLEPSRIGEVIADRNTTVPGGVLQIEDMNVMLLPSGSFAEPADIGGVMIARADDGTPVYLRSLLDIHRGYQSPPQLLTFYTARNEEGEWQRLRAVNLAVQMHSNQQIAQLGDAVDTTLAQVKQTLPEDLIIERVSDQPTQVAENIDLFMTALYEAIALVVIIALIGFWEWRSALLLMISIPVTLAMTFGFISVLGIDLQQVSIAALIIALGLLVDDPVVAGDAIKRELGKGRKRQIAAWLGPTLLATAILFATITNVVAYLPFLLLTGNQGDFLYSLPIVMASALISSRIVSMTFIPFLGKLLLRPPKHAERSLEQRRSEGVTGIYYRLLGWMIDHRKVVLLASLLVVVAGVAAKTQLKNAFFPEDVEYLSTVDVWLKNDASIAATDKVAERVEALIRDEISTYAAEIQSQEPTNILESITTTLGGGAPRFWFTVTPEQRQSNYAQLIVRVSNKDLTPVLAPRLQVALSKAIPGADIDVKQLQTTPVNYPVAIRISSRATTGSENEPADIRSLRAYAAQVKGIISQSPAARSTRDDWGEPSPVLRLDIDNDRANLAGITNQDIAISTSTGINGTQVGTLREGDKQIPIVVRLQLEQRARLSDVGNMYVYSMHDGNKVPLMGIASTDYSFETERVRRLEQFRTITVFSYPNDGFLSADIMKDALPELEAFAATLPEGYQMEISGNHANTANGFVELLGIMGISAGAIFLTLVFQFRNLVKPLLVLAAVPYGMSGALVALYITGQPFGFMAFLGIVSLIGVIVSHIIVLFDFIEERHEAGAPLKEALMDAGVQRLRPILITISATTLALIPLAIHGGPLWQGLCFAQIGGLIIATFGTLLFVPTLYAFVVMDLRAIKWEGPEHTETALATA
ncbi:MAG: efflux RND transporter permease subunit [Pseudomonadota bacterium]